MKLYCMSVFDKKVEAFLQPFFCRTIGEAVRSFTEAVNDPGKQFGRYAGDYSLYRLGEFDDNSGKFDSGEPVHVVSAFEVVEEVAVPRKQ